MCAMPNKQFELCKVCRVNHNQGKGHRYSARHKQRLSSLLSKVLLKLKDISFFLHNPAFLRDSDRPLNSFWCLFCEAQVTEEDSTFVCSNTIRHLASPSHLEALKKFWYENGADVQKKHFYVVPVEELAKWEDACKALSAASTSMELSVAAVNNIHSACSSSVATSFQSFSVACVTNTNTSDPLPCYKAGNHTNGTALQNFEKRSLVDCRFDVHETASVSQSYGAHPQTSINIMDQNQGLTCIRFSSSSSVEGNVHTGAPPPWLQTDESKISSENDALYQKGVPLSRAEQRRLQKFRNPKRVGAAWADKRRAEMEREKAGNCLQRGLEGDEGWLPNFGRVWQSGSRRETRKEFEAEKWLGKGGLEASNKSERPKPVQPYISKRQRLENAASMQPSS